MTTDFNYTYQRTRDNSNDFTNNRIVSWFHNLSLVHMCVCVCISLSLSLSLSICARLCVFLSLCACARVCVSLFYLYPSLRLFRLVGFGSKQVCGGVFVWHKTTTMHLISCRRMLLLFSWRRRAWKERCSLDCFYNGTAATAAACLTGLTRLTDTSAAANIWRDCWRKKAFLSPSAAAKQLLQYKCKCNATVVVGLVFCLVFCCCYRKSLRSTRRRRSRRGRRRSNGSSSTR